MRIRERIDNFMNILDEKILHNMFTTWFDNNFEISEDNYKKILKERRKIKKYWNANHDLRFTQVLVNMGYIDNIPGVWYYMEDDMSLIKSGCDPRDVLFWGKNYDKNMNRLPSTEWVLIKNMSVDHIKAVMAFMGNKLPERYKEAFENELKLKNEVT